MAGKYQDLTRYLEDQPAEEPVSLTCAELDRLVGGLPPSAGQRTWWANTWGHPQAAAWMHTGRRVVEVRLGSAVVFSAADATAEEKPKKPTAKQGGAVILDGVARLDEIVRQAGYGSTVAAVAAHTVFLHPETVAQTKGQALFPIVRDPARRGQIGKLEDGSVVMYDDNTTPTQSFLWAARRIKGPDVQYNHLWGDPRNPRTYTALWNLAVTPAFLAKTTDGSNHPEVLAALRYRAYELFGFYPDGEECPPAPPGYHELSWASPPEPVLDLEAILRGRLASAPKSRPATAARRLGWLYSGWQPDDTLPEPSP